MENLFNKALAELYETGEINNICNMDYSVSQSGLYSLLYVFEERRRARKLRRFLEKLSKTDAGIEGAPFIFLLINANSSEVLKAIIIQMIEEGAENE